MNTVQKAAFAASAFAITLVGAALVTAPMAFAGTEPIAAYHAGAMPGPGPGAVPGNEPLQ